MKMTEKIEGYDNMSAEEKLAALEALEVEEHDDSKLKKALNDATAEASKYKKELKEKMSEAERLEAERKEEQAKKDELLNSLLKEKTIAEHKASFLKVGYDETLATSSATAMADGDFETLFTNLNTFISNRDKAAELKALNNMPRPATGGTPPTVTKEQYDKMTIAQRTKLANEDHELYVALSKGE